MSKFWAKEDDSSEDSSSSDDSSKSSSSSGSSVGGGGGGPPRKGETGGDNRWVMESDSGKFAFNDSIIPAPLMIRSHT
jgi:hypothetical protein